MAKKKKSYLMGPLKAKLPVIPPAQKKVIDRHVREAKKHFIKDGWDLDYVCLEESIFSELFGTNLVHYIFLKFNQIADYDPKTNSLVKRK